jgi:hypothetical protein
MTAQPVCLHDKNKYISYLLPYCKATCTTFIRTSCGWKKWPQGMDGECTEYTSVGNWQGAVLQIVGLGGG